LKIRSVEDLSDILDTDLAWRRKELVALLSEIRGVRSSLRPLFLRAGVALLYAHWEGYTKGAIAAYIEYVARKQLPLDDLNDPLAAMALKSKLSEFEATSKATIHAQFVGHLRTMGGQPTKIPYNKDLSARSNLKSEVLREILTSVGVDYSPYELKEKLIDRQLVDARNSVAHGQGMYVELDVYERMHEEVMGMLGLMNGQLTNAALLEGYRRFPA
jgi:hypothetical protein